MMNAPSIRWSVLAGEMEGAFFNIAMLDIAAHKVIAIIPTGAIKLDVMKME